MQIRIDCFVLVTAVAAGLVPSAFAQRVDSAIAIGESASMWSETLEEERRLLIYLPPGYAKSARAYPVMYLLDAEAHFHHATGIVRFLATDNERIPEMIVVGIPNTNRTRDLTPPTTNAKEREASPDAGGADAFLAFLMRDLVPWVDRRYRTEPFRILVGHSFGGLFNMHVLLSDPDAFQAHIAVSPSLWWNDQALVGLAKARLGRIPASAPHFLYLSWGDNENVIRDPTKDLVGWLEQNPPQGLTWRHRYYAGDDHGSTPHRTLYDGLEAIFDGFRMVYAIDDVDQDYSLADVEAHYEKLSRKYGYKVDPSSEAIAWCARSLAKNGDKEAAIDLLRRNVGVYPYVADAHANLAKALEEAGRLEDALFELGEALRLGVESEHPYGDPIETYRHHAAKIREEIARKSR